LKTPRLKFGLTLTIYYRKSKFQDKLNVYRKVDMLYGE